MITIAIVSKPLLFVKRFLTWRNAKVCTTTHLHARRTDPIEIQQHRSAAGVSFDLLTILKINNSRFIDIYFDYLVNRVAMIGFGGSI